MNQIISNCVYRKREIRSPADLLRKEQRRQKSWLSVLAAPLVQRSFCVHGLSLRSTHQCSDRPTKEKVHTECADNSDVLKPRILSACTTSANIMLKMGGFHSEALASACTDQQNTEFTQNVRVTAICSNGTSKAWAPGADMSHSLLLAKREGKNQMRTFHACGEGCRGWQKPTIL